MTVSVSGSAACSPGTLTSRSESWSESEIQELATYSTIFTITNPVDPTLQAPGIWFVGSASLDLADVDDIVITNTADTTESYSEPFLVYPEFGWIFVTVEQSNLVGGSSYEVEISNVRNPVSV